MISCIVNESNRYAKQCLLAQEKDLDTWSAKVITIDEMKAWLGLVMAMSLHRLPAITDYWKDNWISGVPQGSKLAVSRYPRDIRFKFWILSIISSVSQLDTRKI